MHCICATTYDIKKNIYSTSATFSTAVRVSARSHRNARKEGDGLRAFSTLVHINYTCVLYLFLI